MSDTSMIERLKAAGLITTGTYGPILDVKAVAALLDRPLDVARLARAMSAAYKSVGTWDDFPDAVGAFAAATARFYAEPAEGET